MAIVSNPVSIELDDIQGLLIRGYGQLARSRFVWLRIVDAAAARVQLKSILHQISPATHYDPNLSMNVAFTQQGLSAIGLSDENLRNFPIPFREGMVSSHRQRILGDYGESDPRNWLWGPADQDNYPHILLALYGATQAQLDEFYQYHRDAIEKGGGLQVIDQQDSYRSDDSKELFGFHDSISQPVIRGSGRKGPDNDIVEAGEFVLGYLNEHRQYPFSPLITAVQGDLNLLAPDAAGSGYKDLGRNGTFIAYRKIQQHVEKFWEFMDKKTRRADGREDKDAKIKLASKMVGRWPSGAPLVKFPDKDPGLSSVDNDFGYAEEDPFGFKCPFGSHLRRNNPRDSFRQQGPKQSLKVTQRHRIIRRGRLYERREDPSKPVEEGLQFIGINADIEQQFEFIQHVWVNNQQLKWLTGDPDPIIGVPDPAAPGPQPNRFTIQKEPYSVCVEGLERFVTIRAGAYLFMPGLNALRYLTTL